MNLDFGDFNQHRYEALVAAGLRRQKLVATAREAVQWQVRAGPRPTTWTRFRAWIIVTRMQFARRLQPAEDEGYIA